MNSHEIYQQTKDKLTEALLIATALRGEGWELVEQITKAIDTCSFNRLLQAPSVEPKSTESTVQGFLGYKTKKKPK